MVLVQNEWCRKKCPYDCTHRWEVYVRDQGYVTDAFFTIECQGKSQHCKISIDICKTVLKIIQYDLSY